MASGAEIAGAAGGAAAIIPALIGRGKSQYNAQDISHSEMYDPNAARFGQYGADSYAYGKQQQAQAIDRRTAPQADYMQANMDRQRALQARASQASVMNQLMARAAGQTPSIAQMQADRQMGQAAAQQASLAASARGRGGLANAATTAAANTANAQSGIANQAQINAANERMQAEQAAFGAASGMRGQDYQSQGQAAQQSQFQAGMQLGSRQTNDARAMGYEQMGHQAIGQEQQGKVNMQGIAAQSHANAQNANARTEAQNAQSKGLIDTIGDFFSDMYAKEPVFTSDFSAKNVMNGYGGIGDRSPGFSVPLLGVGGGLNGVGPGGRPTFASGGQMSAEGGVNALRPMSGPAEQSFDVGDSGGGMDVTASDERHKAFGTRFGSNPLAGTGMESQTIVSDKAAKEEAFKLGMEMGQAKAQQQAMTSQPGWKPVEVRDRDKEDAALGDPRVKDGRSPSTQWDRNVDADRQWGRDVKAAKKAGAPEPTFVPPPQTERATPPAPSVFASLLQAPRKLVSDFRAKDRFDTSLSPEEERSYQAWRAKYAPRDSGEDYDLRGAYRAGLTPDPKTGHWPDTYKKPNHETFSDESQYAKDRPALAGRWDGERYTPPSKLGLARDADGNPATGDRDAPQFRYVPGQGWVNDAAPPRYSLEDFRDTTNEPDVGDKADQDARIAALGAKGEQQVQDSAEAEPMASDGQARQAPGTADFEKTEPKPAAEGEAAKGAPVPWWAALGAAGEKLSNAQFGVKSDRRAKEVIGLDGVDIDNDPGAQDFDADEYLESKAPKPYDEDDYRTRRDSRAEQAAKGKAYKRATEDKASKDADDMMAGYGAALGKGSAVASRLAPEQSPVAEANRTMVGSMYRYKPQFTPPEQQPGEPNFGFMAQNLEKSPITATAVKEDPNGLKRVDALKLLRILGASVADLQEQQDETRLALSKGGKR